MIKIKLNVLCFLLFVTLFYYLPVGLYWADVIPFEYRHYSLFAIFMFAVVYVILRGYNFYDLGVRLDNINSALRWSLIPTVALAAIMLICYMQGWIRQPTIPEWPLFAIFYVLVSSPVQEFLFRGLLFYEMGVLRLHPSLQVLLSASTYCFMHIIYEDALTLVVTAVIGIVWGQLYLQCPNVWGIALSHALLGIVAIYVGLI